MSIALWQELQDLKRRVEELEAINAKRLAEMPSVAERQEHADRAERMKAGKRG